VWILRRTLRRLITRINMESDTEPPNYVHIDCSSSAKREKLKEIVDVKREYGVTWFTMLRLGAETLTENSNDSGND
jgi:hypothetical protein